MSFATQEDVFKVGEEILTATFEKFAPEGFEVTESASGKPLITPPGCTFTYEINEILSHRADEPIFLWIDQNGEKHWKKLK